MRVFTGEVEASGGSIQRPGNMGVLAQDQFALDRFRVVDTVIMGNKVLWEALYERDRIYSQAEISDADGMRLGVLEGIVADEDGYTAESDAAILLEGLGVPVQLHGRSMGEVQGGQKVRALLAQALFGNPGALLLDEPTNHLDLESIHWLEGFLAQFKGTVIVISHDRQFLNAVCSRITGDEGLKLTDVLSGGEACRLMFCKLMLQRPNFLVLDEPTNHLDLEAVVALNNALRDYPGTVPLVSHDEVLLRDVATRVWSVGSEQIVDFQGSYPEFLANGA
jgi:ATPase subunit of ABC transporter with duplicated ATPase domains